MYHVVTSGSGNERSKEDKMTRKRTIEEVSSEEPEPKESIVDAVSLDSVSDFDRKVYEACMQIPKGKVSTYKLIASAIGSPRAYRAVGTALRRNPFAPKVPCHRVVSSDLSLGGFFGSTDPAGKLLQRKKMLLRNEGVEFDEKANKAVRVAESSVFTFPSK